MINTTTEQQENKTEVFKKAVAGFKLNMEQKLIKNGDYLILTLKPNRELLNLLKNCCVEGTTFINLTDYKVIDEEIITTEIQKERYRVKTFLYQSMYNRFREHLFLKELIDNGKIDIKFIDISMIENYKTQIKNNIYNLIKCFLSCELSQELIFNINNKESE